MRFAIEAGAQPISGSLRYIEGDHAFDFDPNGDERTRTGFALLVKDLCIEVDDVGRIRYPWGYSPRTSWREERSLSASALDARSAAVFVRDIEFAPGVAESVGGWDDWECFFAPTSAGLRVLYRNRAVSESTDLVRCKVATGFVVAVGADTLGELELVVDTVNIC